MPGVGDSRVLQLVEAEAWQLMNVFYLSSAECRACRPMSTWQRRSWWGLCSFTEAPMCNWSQKQSVLLGNFKDWKILLFISSDTG